MKKLLIICQNSSVNYFKQIALKKITPLKEKSISIISSRVDFDNYPFKDKKFEEIWILVELLWSSSLEDGYNIALDLMQHSGFKNQVLNIVFFSIRTRKTLLKSTNDEKNIFPKAFNHYQLPIDNIKDIKVTCKSKNSFNFIKTYALNKSNLINDIIHSLENIVIGKVTSNKIVHVIRRLKAIQSILNEDIVILLNKSYDDDNQAEILLNKLRELKKSYNNDTTKYINIYKKSLQTVIILEDENEVGKKLIEWLSPYCKNIIYCTNGADAKIKIKENIKLLDLFISDLELLDEEGFWQAIQGIELLKYIKHNIPNVYTVVLSGLTTAAVKSFMPKRSCVHEYIRKKDLFSENAINKSLLPIIKAAKNYSRNFKKLHGPKKQNLNRILPKYYDLKSNYPKEYKALQEKVQHYVDYYNGKKIPLGHFWTTKLYKIGSINLLKAVWDTLPIVLAIRRIIIQFIIKNGATLKYNDKFSYFLDYKKLKNSSVLFSNLDRDFKSLINTYLSFNIHKLDKTKESCYILLENLFEEESKLIDDLMDRSNNEPIINYESFKYLKHFMLEVNESLDTFFDFNEDMLLFENKLTKLAAIVRKDQSLYNLIDLLPYNEEDIPPFYNSIRRTISEFLKIDNEDI